MLHVHNTFPANHTLNVQVYSYILPYRSYFSRDTNFAIEEPVHIRGFIFRGKAPCHAHFIHINHTHYFFANFNFRGSLRILEIRENYIPRKIGPIR